MDVIDLYMDAVEQNDIQAVKRLVKENPKDSFGFDDLVFAMNPLEYAARQGFLECVKLLVEVFDPKESYSFTLQMAVIGGHLECAQFLIPLSNPQNFDMCLCKSIEASPNPCFALMLRIADPSHDHSLPLRLACAMKNEHMIDALYPLSDPQIALKEMKRCHTSEDIINTLEQRIHSDKEKAILEQSVGQSHNSSPKIKTRNSKI